MRSLLVVALYLGATVVSGQELRRGKWLQKGMMKEYGHSPAMKWYNIRHWAITVNKTVEAKLYRVLNAAASPDKDIYQFGVYTGGSLRQIPRVIRGFGNLWGFDSFVGLPEEKGGLWVPGMAQRGNSHWREGGFSAADAFGLYDMSSLLNRIKRSVKYKRLELIPGFYNVSLTDELLRRHRFQPALLVDVDADMYVSTMQCLTWMFQNRLITAGTFVRYDDWPSCIEPDPSKCPPVWGQELAHRHLTGCCPRW